MSLDPHHDRAADEPAEGAAASAVPASGDGAAAGLRRAAAGEQLTAASLLGGIGGVLGIVESVLPALIFLVVFQITHAVLPSVAAPLALSVVFVVIRVVRRQKVSSAVGGAVAAGLSAVLALTTGNPTNAFALGLLTNAAYFVVLAASVLVRRPLLGVVVSLLLGEPGSWRADAAKRRLGLWLTVLWIGLFAVRLIVEVPFYLANRTTDLGIARLVLGVPLYAPVLVLTFLAVQAVYRRHPASDVS